jgi:AcrR family transcriptional regulator
MAAPPERRTYESPLRAVQAEQTRAAILDAATRLFVERGWNGTGMRDLARAAHVSVETVYANFGSKAELLRQAVDVAVVGDTAPVPLADRGDFRQLGQGGPADRVAAAAALVTEARQRTSQLNVVLSQAAPGNPELTELLAASLASQRETIRQGAVAVAGREVSEEDVDALFAMLSSEVFLLLTQTRGWSLPQYRSWVARTVRTVLHLEGI